MDDVASNTVIKASEVALDTSDVPADQVAGGRPQAGHSVLGSFGGLEVGVWEMSAGAMRDTEVDEIFVVISGDARVEFEDGTAPIELSVGDIVRLTAGTKTVWTVRERVRKVYLA